MNQLKCYTLIGIIFVLIIGTLAHFLYAWTGNNFIVGLLTPVNESVWEHMKLLFFPMLLYSSVLILKLKDSYPCIPSGLYLGLLAGTWLIPPLFYFYTGILGKNYLILDISVFILSTIIAFIIAYKFTLSCILEPYTPVLLGLVCALLLCFIFFTSHPPNAEIFAVPEEK